MNTSILVRALLLVTAVLAGAASALAQQPPPNRLEGVINDYTADLDGQGAWHIVGEWSLFLKGQSGRVDFIASLTMVRADNVARASHTHHVGIINGEATPIANGYRITGNAIITGNGAAAGFSGSRVDVEITGGALVPLANAKVTFGGGAIAHFGDQPLDGVVTMRP
jgi:hypothetical protein